MTLSSNYLPAGRVFYDVRSGRTMILVEEPGYVFDGWLCYKHPDGQWVSLRKVTEDDRARINAAEAHRDPVANAINSGEDRYRATALSQKPLREISIETPP